MPKEYIYCEPTFLLTDDTSNALVVEIGWTKDIPGSHVTVASYDRPNDTHPLAPTRPQNVLTTPLSRSGVNRLINVLRKARDQAFGADA
jgi:hypothetical protein